MAQPSWFLPITCIQSKYTHYTLLFICLCWCLSQRRWGRWSLSSHSPTSLWRWEARGKHRLWSHLVLAGNSSSSERWCVTTGYLWKWLRHVVFLFVLISTEEVNCCGLWFGVFEKFLFGEGADLSNWGNVVLKSWCENSTADKFETLSLRVLV